MIYVKGWQEHGGGYVSRQERVETDFKLSVINLRRSSGLLCHKGDIDLKKKKEIHSYTRTKSIAGRLALLSNLPGYGQFS